MRTIQKRTNRKSQNGVAQGRTSDRDHRFACCVNIRRQTSTRASKAQQAPKAGRHTTHTRAARTTKEITEGEHRAEQFSGFTTDRPAPEQARPVVAPRQADTQGGANARGRQDTPTPRQAPQGRCPRRTQTPRTRHTHGQGPGCVSGSPVRDCKWYVCPVALFVSLSGSKIWFLVVDCLFRNFWFLSDLYTAGHACCARCWCSENGARSFRLFAPSNEGLPPRAHECTRTRALFVARLISSVLLVRLLVTCSWSTYARVCPPHQCHFEQSCTVHIRRAEGRARRVRRACAFAADRANAQLRRRCVSPDLLRGATSQTRECDPAPWTA